MHLIYPQGISHLKQWCKIHMTATLINKQNVFSELLGIRVLTHCVLSLKALWLTGNSFLTSTLHERSILWAFFVKMLNVKS